MLFVGLAAAVAAHLSHCMQNHQVLAMRAMYALTRCDSQARV